MDRPEGLMDLENETRRDLLQSLAWHKEEIKTFRPSELRHEFQGVIESIQWELGQRRKDGKATVG